MLRARPRPAGPLQRGEHGASTGWQRPAATHRPGSLGWSTHRRRSTTPSASRRTWPPNSRRVPLLVGPLARRHQLARRTGIRPAVVIRRCAAAIAPATAPTPSRSWPASCAPPAAQPRLPPLNHRDVARAPNPSSPSSSAFRRRRVGGQPPNHDFEARPVPDAGALGALAPFPHRGIATVEASPREHTVGPSDLGGGAETSSLQAHFRPVFIGESPGKRIR